MGSRWSVVQVGPLQVLRKGEEYDVSLYGFTSRKEVDVQLIKGEGHKRPKPSTGGRAAH